LGNSDVPVAIGEHAEMSNLDEMGWQNMKPDSADELVQIKSHQFF
jgi:hypothetical protein